MKKVLLLLSFLGILVAINAQIPDAFSYQAVIRDNDRALLKNQTVTITTSIIRNEEVIFTQMQTATTNENGLLSITVGNESFQEIEWTDGPLFIKTQIDPLGGDNYTIETETQLLSVPYAMTAKTAETALAVPEMDYLLEKIDNLEKQLEELQTYIFPVEVSYDEYSLNQTPCYLLDFQGPCDNEELIIINSMEDLRNYANCPGGTVLPEIDFSVNTLLLARGVECNLAVLEDKSLQKLSPKRYVMNVNLKIYEDDTLTPWLIPIIVNKINEDSTVELIVTRGVYESEKVPFTKYFLESYECPCGWLLPYSESKLIVINSNEELHNYIFCHPDLPECTPPEFDFSTYTLLIVNYRNGYPIIDFDVDLQKTFFNKYEMNVDVQLLKVEDIGSPRLNFAILVEKLNGDSNVELTFNEHDVFPWLDDGNNIEKLYEKPLEEIQQCVQGKWKLFGASHYRISDWRYGTSYFDVFVEVDLNEVVITSEGYFSNLFMPIQIHDTSFSYSWEYKDVLSCYEEDWTEWMNNGLPFGPLPNFNTFVMQRNEQEIEGWYFESIYNGILRVVVDNPPFITGVTVRPEVYLLFRVSENK